MSEAMGYVLSLPVSTVIIGCDTIAQLEENVSVATAFTQLAPHEMENLESLTASYHEYAAWFKKPKKLGFFTGEDDQNTD